jgi:hypothetical protein
MRKHDIREYGIWTNIKTRCYNQNTRAYQNYGARGITLCAEWDASFDVFLAAVGPAPSRLHSLDRIDNDRGYEPGNMR